MLFSFSFSVSSFSQLFRFQLSIFSLSFFFSSIFEEMKRCYRLYLFWFDLIRSKGLNCIWALLCEYVFWCSLDSLFSIMSYVSCLGSIVRSKFSSRIFLLIDPKKKEAEDVPSKNGFPFHSKARISRKRFYPFHISHLPFVLPGSFVCSTVYILFYDEKKNQKKNVIYPSFFAID